MYREGRLKSLFFRHMLALLIFGNPGDDRFLTISFVYGFWTPLCLFIYIVRLIKRNYFLSVEIKTKWLCNFRIKRVIKLIFFSVNILLIIMHYLVPGISTRKTKWALWCDCICHWEHLVICPILAIGYIHSWGYILLPSRSSEGMPALSVFHLCFIF